MSTTTVTGATTERKMTSDSLNYIDSSIINKGESVVNMHACMGIELATGLNLHKHYENKFSLKRATNVHQYLSFVL